MFAGVMGSAPAGIMNNPTLEATKSAAKSTRRMTTTITGCNAYFADNVRYVKLDIFDNIRT